MATSRPRPRDGTQPPSQQLHPMQPSLMSGSMPTMPPLPPGPPPPGGAQRDGSLGPSPPPPLGVAASPMVASHNGPAGGGGASSAPSAATGRESGRVRCPPAPSRSPPLPPEQVYTAAGWVAGGEELGAALLSAGRGNATASVGGDGASGASGLFLGWSSGSSEDEEADEEAEASANTAKAVQSQLNSNPLWVLGMFAPSVDGNAKAGADSSDTAASAAAASMAPGDGSGDVSVPARSQRSTSCRIRTRERRGAAAGRAVRLSRETAPEVGEGDEQANTGMDGDDGNSSDEEAELDDEDMEEGDEAEGGGETGEGLKRRRGNGRKAPMAMAVAARQRMKRLPRNLCDASGGCAQMQRCPQVARVSARSLRA